MDLRCWLWLAAIAAAALALRLFNLGGESLWFDEAASLHFSHHPLADPGNPPLYYLVLDLWTRAFGTSEVALRSLSTLAGVASVLAIFLLARELFDQRTGLVAAALLAVLPGHVFYSQEARQYAPVVLTGILASLEWVRATRTDLWRHWCASALLCGVGFHLHYTGALVPAFLAVHALLEARRARAFAALGLAAVLCLPGLALRLAPSGPGGYAFWLERFSFEQLGDVANLWFGWILVTDGPILSNVGFGLMIMMAVGVALGACAEELSSWRDGPPRPALFGLLYLLVPVALFAAAAAVKPVWHPRYVLVALPGAVLLFARAVSRGRFAWRALVTGCLVAVSAMSLATAPMRWHKGDWRAAAASIEAVERSSGGRGRVLLTRPFFDLPFGYYYRGSWPRYGYEFESCEQIQRLADAARGETVVVIEGAGSNGDRYHTLARQLVKAGGAGQLRNRIGMRIWAFGPGAQALDGIAVELAGGAFPRHSPCP